MSMGLMMIWPNITIVVNVIFQEILALTRVRYTVSSVRGIVQTNCKH